MRIIANDVILSKGSQGSNPCLSAEKLAEFCELFLCDVRALPFAAQAKAA
jgi:hypothetical protein